MSDQLSGSRKVPVEDIVLDERCQARATVDHEAVAEYAEAYGAGATLPPLEVWSVSGKLYLVDGFHRFPAAAKAGVTFLRVRVVGQGTLDEAVWYATSVNQTHGVRRTNEDKRRAVRMALESPIGQEQSTAALAQHLGVSRPFVAKLRSEWEAAQTAARAPQGATVAPSAPAAPEGSEPPPQGATVAPSAPKRTGRDGKRYPARLAPEEPTPTPTAQPMPTYGPALEETAADLARVRRSARARIPEGLNALRQELERLTRKAETACRTRVPIVCANCQGSGCQTCGRRGWVTSVQGV